MLTFKNFSSHGGYFRSVVLLLHLGLYISSDVLECNGINLYLSLILSVMYWNFEILLYWKNEIVLESVLEFYSLIWVATLEFGDL